MRFLPLIGATAYAADRVHLSYGAFDAYYCEPLEMAQAIQHCSQMNGRLPRFNNHDDYNALGALYAKYGLTHTWVRSREVNVKWEVKFSRRSLMGR